jgi:hypothetical protein
MNIQEDYLTSYADNTIKVSIDEPVHITPIYYKIVIYNANIDVPLQKFLFVVKKIKVIWNDDNKIKIALPNKSSVKFLEYLDKLDDTIHSIIKKNVVTKKKKSYHSKKYYPTVLFLNTYKTESYDTEKIYTVVIELTDILVDSENGDYWINYSAKMIKEEGQPDKDVICVPEAPPMFVGPVQPELHLNEPVEIKTEKKFEKPQLVEIIEKPQSSSAFVVSADDLKNQLDKMRNKKREQKKRLENDMFTQTQKFYKELEERKRINMKLNEEFQKLMSTQI